MAQPNRVAEVNRELRRMGREERLTRGAGYYYFRGGDSLQGWPSVYIYRASDMTLAEWMEEIALRVK